MTAEQSARLLELLADLHIDAIGPFRAETDAGSGHVWDGTGTALCSHMRPQQAIALAGLLNLLKDIDRPPG